MFWGLFSLINNFCKLNSFIWRYHSILWYLSLKKTIFKISRQISEQLAERIKILRVFPSKKGFIEEIVKAFYTTLKRFKEQEAVFVLLGSPKLTKQGLLFPIAGLSEVVFGFVQCRMDLTTRQALRNYH